MWCDIVDKDGTEHNYPAATNLIHFWTDSTIVLAWLNKPPTTWNTFAAHRMSAIAEAVGTKDWSHVASYGNPADVVSRGCNAEELIDYKLWWNGTTWLKEDPLKWPTTHLPSETQTGANICQSFLRL